MKDARPPSDITDEDLLDFVDYIREGMEPPEAAAKIGTTGTVMKKFRSPASQWFDEIHAREFEAAMEDPDRASNQLERLRAARWAEIDRGNTTLILKESLAIDPIYEPLRHTNFRIQGSVDVYHQLKEKFSEEQLAEMEQQRLRELKALPESSAA